MARMGVFLGAAMSTNSIPESPGLHRPAKLAEDYLPPLTPQLRKLVEAAREPASRPSERIKAAGSKLEIVNFLEDILERLKQSPARIVMEELRPSGKIAVTAGQLLEKTAAARAFFIAAGLREGDRCALLAPNSIAWAAIDLAAMAEGIVVVPLYARQAPAELCLMLRDSQPRLVCCGDAGLREIARAAWPASAGATEAPLIALFDEVLASHAPGDQGKVAAAPVALADGDPVTIIYTSGTSGEPKGVVLTAGNITYILSCTKQRLDRLMGARAQPDGVFHYLPFCFASSWILMLSCLLRQSVLRLSTDLTRIADDLRASQPDYCVNVPALLERMRASIEEARLPPAEESPRQFSRNAQAAWIQRSTGPAKWRQPVCWQPGARDDISGHPQTSRRKSQGAHQRVRAAGQRDAVVFHAMLGIPVLQLYGLTETTGTLHDG